MAKLPDIRDAVRFDENLREVPRWPDRIAYAIRRGRKQLQDSRDEGNETQVLRTLGYLTDACRVAGELDAAVGYGQEALERARSAGNRNAEIANLIRLGEAHKYRDEHETAEALFREALALTSENATDPLHDFAHQHLGKCLIDQGRYDEAIEHLEQALTVRRAKGNQPLIESTEQAIALARAKRDAPTP
jgi:tetratricopeptide (TPR) repeat protein